jgi:hypothetical protein
MASLGLIDGSKQTLADAYDKVGRTHITWVVVVILGSIAYFTKCDTSNLPAYLAFLGAAGGFQTYRSVKAGDTRPATKTDKADNEDDDDNPGTRALGRD